MNTLTIKLTVSHEKRVIPKCLYLRNQITEAENFVKSDGGRLSAGVIEKNDCTVRAYAHASGKDYLTAHTVLKEHGRKDRKRLKKFPKIAHSIGKALGIELKQVKRTGSLGKLLKEYPQGVLIVSVRGHLFTVKDGKIFDTVIQSEARHIKQAYLVSPITVQA